MRKYKYVKRQPTEYSVAEDTKKQDAELAQRATSTGNIFSV